MPQFLRLRPYLLLLVLLLVHRTILSCQASEDGTSDNEDNNDDRSCLATNDGDGDDGSCQATTTTTAEGSTSEPTIPSTMPSSVEIQMMAERFGVDPSKPKPNIVCEDKNEKCQEWANSGQCKKNPKLMNVECRRSCELCAGQEYVYVSTVFVRCIWRCYTFLWL